MKKLYSIILILLISCNVVFSEVSVKYNHNMCKLEIISSQDITQTRNTKTQILNKVEAFCKDKYIYNLDLTIDKQGNYIFIIFYNDKQE